MRVFPRIPPLAALGYGFLLAINPPLSAEGTKTLVTGDGGANRLNMVFLAEGYTQAEQSKFVADVRKNTDQLFLCRPWSLYKSLCNVYAIGVVSQESGSDHPDRGTSRNTYFESSFGYPDGRLVTLANERKVAPLLAEHVPDYDLVCVLVNDSVYGGSGGQYSVATLNSACTYLILHESGHSFAHLADEYESAYSMSPSESRNVTAKTQRSQIRWNVWIDPSTPVPTPETEQYFAVPGLFEGAMYQTTGWYRPKFTCAMRTSGDMNFCEVCREEVIAGIYSVVSMIDSFYPPVTSDVKNLPGTFLSVRPVKPDSSALKIEWRVNDSLPATASDSLELARAGLRPGRNIVTARISDTTALVRISANRRLLVDSLRWTVDNSITGIVPVTRRIENSFRIVRMSGGAHIVCELQQPQRVNISMWDIRGVLLLKSHVEMQCAGMHVFRLDGVAAAPGVRIVRILVGSQSMTMKFQQVTGSFHAGTTELADKLVFGGPMDTLGEYLPKHEHQSIDYALNGQPVVIVPKQKNSAHSSEYE